MNTIAAISGIRRRVTNTHNVVNTAISDSHRNALGNFENTRSQDQRVCAIRIPLVIEWSLDAT